MTKNGEIGQLWSKTGAKGEYMTGSVNGVRVVLFKNDKKDPGSKAPDWRVLLATKQQEGPLQQPSAPDKSLDENDIPF
jgi:uncharacterized protein (DUF736 family)